MEDAQIVELYWKKDGEAVHQSEVQYGGYCLTIADNILHSHEDSEECVNDTWLHAWNAIPPQRPNRLKYFLARITRNLALDRWHSLTAEKQGGGGIEPVLEELAECADPAGKGGSRTGEERMEAFLCLPTGGTAGSTGALP